MHAIVTQRLTKVYRSHLGMRGKPCIEDLELRVLENEVYGFLGRNGAGKTTTIKILCGLIRETRGTARVHGIDVRKRGSRKMVGYLPENPYFYEYLTPKETLDFYGRLEGLSRKRRQADWDRLSEWLDLRGIAEQRVRGFSKGMRQRLGFAVAMVGDPKILILDEPMSGLDPLGRRTIRDLILSMREEKKTVFFSSHVLGDVEQICDRVGMLINGKLHAEGDIDELLQHRVDQVDVIAKGISDDVVDRLRAMAKSCRNSEDGVHFSLGDLSSANDLARQVHAANGDIVEFTPIKESLEDFFVREQETTEVQS